MAPTICLLYPNSDIRDDNIILDLKDALHKLPRRVHLRTRAVCRVANPRHSVGYGCGLRLAFHPDPQRTFTARLMQSILNKLM
jgi:hypothetical protein